jgi:hypothetical protein
MPEGCSKPKSFDADETAFASLAMNTTGCELIS